MPTPSPETIAIALRTGMSAGVAFLIAFWSVFYLDLEAGWKKGSEWLETWLILLPSLAGGAIAHLWPSWRSSNRKRAVVVAASFVLAIVLAARYKAFTDLPKTEDNAWYYHEATILMFGFTYFFLGYSLGQAGRILIPKDFKSSKRTPAQGAEARNQDPESKAERPKKQKGGKKKGEK